jgi:superfamily II DNA or RNA helicase
MATSKDQIQTETLAALRPHHQAGAGVSMGVGKTLIGLKHMAENYTDYSRFLVVAPKRSILAEWIDEAKKHGLEFLIPHMTFTTYLSLSKQDHGYDGLYLDECHNLLNSHDEWLAQFKGKITGLTGTAPKYKHSEKGKMVDKYCPIVYTYITDDAVEDKILNDYRIIVHKLTLSAAKTLKVEYKDKSWYTSELETYNYWSGRVDNATHPKQEQIMRVMRMKALMGFASKEAYAHKLLSQINEKCLLFVNTQVQADKLCAHSYHSKNPERNENLRKFKVGEITKLSAVLQLSEGVNIPDLRFGIIMHAYGNERKTAQRIGRLLRLNPNDVATIHILCYINTVDEKWVNDALSGFDSSKISWIYPG